MWLIAMRLEKGRFVWPPIVDGTMTLTPALLSAVAEAERDRTRERVAEVKRGQRQRGRYLDGAVPGGFASRDSKGKQRRSHYSAGRCSCFRELLLPGRRPGQHDHSTWAAEAYCPGRAGRQPDGVPDASCLPDRLMPVARSSVLWGSSRSASR
jgi:hypothetical protein